jgi:hypothetical protein
MQRALFPGNYTLWVYEPRPQLPELTSFAAYDLELHVSPMVSRDDPLDCPARRLPDSFNTAGYLGVHFLLRLRRWEAGRGSDVQDTVGVPSLGFLQVADEFFLDFSAREREIDFELAAASLVRAHVPAHRIDIDLLLIDRATGHVLDGSATFNEDDVVVATLPPGRYALLLRFFLPHDSAPGAACETFRFQIAVRARPPIPFPVAEKAPADAWCLDRAGVQRACGRGPVSRCAHTACGACAHHDAAVYVCADWAAVCAVAAQRDQRRRTPVPVLWS